MQTKYVKHFNKVTTTNDHCASEIGRRYFLVEEYKFATINANIYLVSLYKTVVLLLNAIFH